MPRRAHAGPPLPLPEESAGTAKQRSNGKKQALMREINKRLMKVVVAVWGEAGRDGWGG